jgi:transposase
MDVEPEKVEATLARIKPQLEAQDFELIARLWSTLMLVMRLVRAQRASLARLRRLFGLSTSEKTREVTGAGVEASQSDPESAPGGSAAQGARGGEADAAGKTKPKGHGRLGVSDYPTAVHHAVLHAELKVGERCPLCEHGNLYMLEEPARILRILGQPLLAAHCWDCQRLRCSGCGHVFTAQAPAEAQGPKFDETAVAMIGLCRYGMGLPLHRLERLQRNLQTPLSSSTQWDALDQNAPALRPPFEQLERLAAQGSVIHNDDTYVRILSFMGERRAQLLQAGELPDPDRTGMFTTAVVSNTEFGTVALFYSGRKHAGENLNKLLTARDPERAAPILMSDALSRNVPKDHVVVEANCTAHARRPIVDQFPNFPAECRTVLLLLREVYAVEADCKARKLTPDKRLAEHQGRSAPVMSQLFAFMTEELASKRAEPNSGLGKAYQYMLKRWDKLTLFLRAPGAPLENNICERALKMAICHRRNSLFYRTQHGATVGDMFTSLIHTAELHGKNPFDYLTALLHHARAVAEQPAAWMPWTYEATLAGLSSQA